MRTCIACRKKDSKENFIRIVADNNVPFVDKNQKENKRGMYICNNTNCIEALIKSKHINKAVKIKADTDLLKNLLETMK